MKTSDFNRSLLIILFVIPVSAFAQDETSNNLSCFSNALFNTLLVLIVVLLIVIIALGQALKNIAGSDLVLKLNKKKEDDTNSSGIKTTVVAAFILAALSANAETNSSSADNWAVGGLDQSTFFFMLSVIFFEALVIYMLYRTIMYLVKDEVPVKVQVREKKKTILEKINASVDIDKEHDIMLDHNYDGIKELDNDLPPWWKYGFYVTIVFAGIYLINYHVTRTGDLQASEYEKSLAQAKTELEEYMKTAANNVDETNVKLLGDADISSGKEIFIQNCATCHGKEGQGSVGPNLADAYWLHGGGVTDVFKSIKYGWVDKGMKSWKEDLSPMQIAQLTSFIYNIQGSNPAGAKAPQGDLYKAESLAEDTTLVKTDSISVVKDTLH